MNARALMTCVIGMGQAILKTKWSEQFRIHDADLPKTICLCEHLTVLVRHVVKDKSEENNSTYTVNSNICVLLHLFRSVDDLASSLLRYKGITN